MLRPLVLSVSLVAAASAAADPTPLSGDALNELVAGSSVVIDAPMGFKLPIRHGEDGTLSGEAGSLSFYLGSPSDTGKWWVAQDRLCYKWSKWFDGERRCMKIRHEGARIFWEKEDGETGTGTVTQRAQRPPPAPSAVAARQSTPPTATTSRSAAPQSQPSAAAVAAPKAAARPATPPPSNATAQPPALAAVQPPRPAAPAKPAIQGATASAAAPAKASGPWKAAAAPQTGAGATAVSARPPSPSALVQAGLSPDPGRLLPTAAARPPLPGMMSVRGPRYRVVSVEDSDVLNIRSGPSAEHPTVGAIPPQGRGVALVGQCLAEWCPIRHAGRSGWVHSYYLAADPAEGGWVARGTPRLPPPAKP